MIIGGMGLLEAKGVSSAGEDEKKHEEEKNKKILDADKMIRFRSITASANYLAQDLPDLMCVVKELCRSMSSPRLGAWRSLKGLARYLIDHPRQVFEYKWQGRDPRIQ